MGGDLKRTGPYLRLHSGEGDCVCFAEANNDALSLAVSEFP
jgi:hypothetical protein